MILMYESEKSGLKLKIVFLWSVMLCSSVAMGHCLHLVFRGSLKHYYKYMY